MKRIRLTLPALLIAILAVSAAPSAQAGITNFDAFGNQLYNQTSSAQPVTPFGAFFASRIMYNTAGDVTAANGMSASQFFTYANQPGNFALAQTTLITPAQLATYLTPGSAFSANVTAGNLAGQSVSRTLAALSPSAVPFLTGTSYAQLQGLNASQADTITFNGFTPVNGANESDVFLTISRVSDGAVAYTAGFLLSTTTSVFVSAGTLAANTAYNLELDYSSRINTSNAGFNGATFTQGFDQRTEVAFTTAPVPEPSSLALTAIGAVALGLALRRRQRGPAL